MDLDGWAQALERMDSKPCKEAKEQTLGLMAVVPVIILHGFGRVKAGSGKNGLKAVQRGQCIICLPLHTPCMSSGLIVLHTVSSKPFWFNPDHFHRVEAEHRSAVMFLKS